MGYKPKAVLGHVGDITPQYFKIGGPATVGTFHTTPFNAGTSAPKAKAFVASYRTKYGVDPDLCAAEGYQSIWFAAQGIKGASKPTDAKSVQSSLASIKSLDGVLGADGKITIGSDRVLRYTGFIVRSSETGEFVPWKP
jgi:branched-chain amino acid transport system substrate-binding protein